MFYRWIVRCAVVVTLAALALMVTSHSPLSASEAVGLVGKAKVYVYSKMLTEKDLLSFGPGTEQKKTIPIKGETTLIYVDLAPDARFGHPTQCILISTEGTRVIKGDWWLILNGKPLFRDGKASTVDIPITLTSK